MSPLIIKTNNPYDYNSVIAKQMENKLRYTPSAERMRTNSDIHLVAQFLGIDTTHEWNQFSDKIWDLYNWGSIATKSEDATGIIKFLKEKLATTPEMNGRRINDLFIAYKLDKLKTPEEIKAEQAEEKKESEAENTKAEEAQE